MNLRVVGLLVAAFCAIGILLYQWHVEEQAKRDAEYTHAVVALLHAQVDARLQEERLAAEAEVPEIICRLQTVLSREFSWRTLLDVGHIYKTGAFPSFAPNPEMAERLFRAAAGCPDPDVAGIGQAKFMEVRAEPLAREDIQGQQLPTQYGQTLLDQTSRMLLCKTSSAKPKAAVFIAAPERVLSPPLDLQNVHDHGVMSAMRKSIEKLPSASCATSDPVASLEAVVARNEDMTDEDKAKALHFIDSLSGEKHSSLGISERDALHSVWSRIESMSDQRTKDNATETLAKQLASGVERGHVVCSTGKIARMVGALDGIVVDDHHMAKPLWALKDEMSTLAAKIRHDVLQSVPPSVAMQYDDGKAPEVEATMRRTFLESAEKEYCGKLGMQRGVVHPLIEQVSEGF